MATYLSGNNPPSLNSRFRSRVFLKKRFLPQRTCPLLIKLNYSQTTIDRRRDFKSRMRSKLCTVGFYNYVMVNLKLYSQKSEIFEFLYKISQLKISQLQKSKILKKIWASKISPMDHKIKAFVKFWAAYKLRGRWHWWKSPKIWQVDRKIFGDFHQCHRPRNL